MGLWGTGAVIVNNVIAPQTDLGYLPERFSGICGEAIGGSRVVVYGSDSKMHYADCQDLTHANKILGITLQAGVADEVIILQAFGQISDSSWTWDVTKAIWLGSNGLLTQTIPSSGFIIKIGEPSSQTSFIVRIKMPIVLQEV